MLDKKIVVKTSEGNFTPIDTGVYTCQIVDVNIKEVLKYQSTEMEEVLLYQLEIGENKKMTDGSSCLGRFLWKKCRPSLNSKSWLFKLAKACYGRELTSEEMNNFDPESLVGLDVDAMVEAQDGKDGKVWSNIISFSKASKQIGAMATNKGVSVVEKATKSVVDDEIEKLDREAKVATRAKK
jgi:hypothetical protein